jgi:hypothetical protein
MYGQAFRPPYNSHAAAGPAGNRGRHAALHQCSIMLLMLFGWNGWPRSLTWPAAASSALIWRKLRRSPVFGFARRKRLAMATTSGFSSLCDLRPSTFRPPVRLRSRAAFRGSALPKLVRDKSLTPGLPNTLRAKSAAI